MKNGFITNSTAYSIATICKEFLNEHLTLSEVSKLRETYRINNLIDNKFTVDELLSAVENQAAYLIDLFINNGIETNLEEKELEAKENKDKDAVWLYENLRSQFERTTYHTMRSCEYMFKDFDEEEAFFKNTGMFGVTFVQKKIYILKEDFLIKLGLRQCNKCYDVEDKAKTIIRQMDLEERIRLHSTPEFAEQRGKELIENWKNLSENELALAQKALKGFQEAVYKKHPSKEFQTCKVIGFKVYYGGWQVLKLDTGHIIEIVSGINNTKAYKVKDCQFTILEF